MQLRVRLFKVIGVIAACSALSCGEDPTRLGRPPVVQGFSPADQALRPFTGDTLVFSIQAIDPDNSRLTQLFMLGDSVVSDKTRWDYIVEDTGAVTVTCMVTDGEYTSDISWNLERQKRINHNPIITMRSPVETTPTMVIDTELEFAIEGFDPDNDPLTFFFTIDGEQVATDARYRHTATEIGLREVEAVVSDGELFAVQRWTLRVTRVPDTDPPAEVIITMLETGGEPGEIDVAWTAVGQDGMIGQASNYLVRTSPTQVISEADWERASEHPNTPAPSPAGQTMNMTIIGMIPGRFTHVTVRALDDFSNLSPIGQSPGAYTRGMRISGIVRDAISLGVLGDIEVKLAHFSTTTDQAGEFQFIELPPVDGSFSLLDETVPGALGSHFDYQTMYEIVHKDYLEMFMLPNRDVNTPFYADFLLFYRAMTDKRGIPPETRQRRWELPIDLYVPPFWSNGVDYQSTIIAVSQEFEAILGTPMFNIVSSVPETGVQILYLPGILSDNYQVTDWTETWYPQKAQIKFRTHYASGTVEPFRVVIRHELGHAVGLNHSFDTGHLMVGGQAPGTSWFTPVELDVIKVHYNIPRGHEMRDHKWE